MLIDIGHFWTPMAFVANIEAQRIPNSTDWRKKAQECLLLEWGQLPPEYSFRKYILLGYTGYHPSVFINRDMSAYSAHSFEKM